MSLRTIALVIFVAVISVGLAFNVSTQVTNIVAGISGLVWCALTIVGREG